MAGVDRALPYFMQKATECWPEFHIFLGQKFLKDLFI